MYPVRICKRKKEKMIGKIQLNADNWGIWKKGLQAFCMVLWQLF